MKSYLTLAALSVLLLGCYYDNEEELYPSEGGCDTTDISYAANILPIMQNNCYRCHDARNNQGNITLEGYANLKVYADNGRLLGAIRWDAGFSPMPQDASKLSDCTISQVEAWINAGAPNN